MFSLGIACHLRTPSIPWWSMIVGSLAPARVLKAAVFLLRSYGGLMDDAALACRPPYLLARPDSTGARASCDAREQCNPAVSTYVSDASDSAPTLVGMVSGSRSPGAIASSPRRTITCRNAESTSTTTGESASSSIAAWP